MSDVGSDHVEINPTTTTVEINPTTTRPVPRAGDRIRLEEDLTRTLIKGQPETLPKGSVGVVQEIDERGYAESVRFPEHGDWPINFKAVAWSPASDVASDVAQESADA